MTTVDLGPLTLESGVELAEVTVALQSWGTLNATASNAVLVLHALTGDSHVTGPVSPEHPSPGWWSGLVGPGAALDTDEWCVIAPNVLGGCRGTTGPSSLAPDGKAWGSRFPAITIRDQVAMEAALADRLGVPRFAAVMGGSMGGMRALEWVVGHPDRVGAALVLATGARATADQIGTQSAQILAITSDPDWQGGDYHGTGRSPRTGLGLARRIAHLSYRAEHELDSRFANLPQEGEDPAEGGRYAVQSYLDHQAAKLVQRFDAGSYVRLTDSMNSYDVGRGRGGVAAALRGVRRPVVVGGIDSDRLYPLRLQAELAEGLPTCDRLRVITSEFGHDGFLLEADAVSELIQETLARSAD
ncbi:homoserine O-acetyltransferase [Rhodococcus sp. X156]|uniref:homoserine O-acetyltransferase MetX n=1 Tax=Rhodococcus sp. X156 TaxID=2499145 RepID=UPI000FD8CA89|nr:homoserine O-acetyltransferase [Rhodococcus sp. X156]